MAIDHKKWVRIYVIFLFVFIGANGVIWKLFTEDILTFTKYYNGGLDRMGYIIGSKHYRNPESTLPRKHIENYDYNGQHIDVLTIGDSFSNVKNNGRDPLYQDWIASLHGLDVLNVQHFPQTGGDMLSSVAILLNSGYLDKVKPRFIIVETVERNCALLYSKKIDFKITLPINEVEEYFKTAAFKQNWPTVGFINTGNFKIVLNSALYKFSDHAYFSDVYVRTLDRPFFSVKNETRLLFYKDDVICISFDTEKNLKALNDNFNVMADLLQKKGIALYFMPAADKYNMYSNHVVNNPYPKSTFFEILRALPKHYILIDTKAMLSEEIQKGEKDIYYADDTHWSWKAAKKIAENVRFSQDAHWQKRRTQ